MSIKLMSAIFEAEFRDLEYVKDGETRKAKASTCKLVLLAIADHANDYGEAYPGYTKLEIKTALSRQGLSDTIEALKYNGLLSVSEKPSRLKTNDYTINIRALPAVAKELPDVIHESSHLTSASQATLPVVVKPLDSNHQLTINQSSMAQSADEEIPLPLDWQLGMGAKKITLPTEEQEFAAKVDLACMSICKYGADLESLARAFISSRRIFPGKRDAKGWATAFREMKNANVTPQIVKDVIEDLIAKKLTIADPWAIRKTAIATANPMPTDEPVVTGGVFYG